MRIIIPTWVQERERKEQAENAHSDRKRRYAESRKVCPMCDSYCEVTTGPFGYPNDVNRARCNHCKWSGKVHDMIPAPINSDS